MIEELLRGYTEYLRSRQYSEGTIHKYEKDARETLKYMNAERNTPRVQDIKKEDIKSYQDRIYIGRRQSNGGVLSISTKSGKIVSLKNFFKFLLKRGEILYNPAEDVEVPRVRRDRVRDVLKEKEIKKMIEGVGEESRVGIRDRAILEVLYSTGVRNTELRELKISDVDFEKEEVRIRKGKGYFGHRERVLPLGRLAAAYLMEYVREVRPRHAGDKEADYLFLSWRGNKLSIGAPNRIARKYALRSGIKKKVVAHTIRHTCATHLLRGGADIRYVQELLGHSSLDSTKVYTKVEISDLKKAHRRSHPREKL